MKTIRISHKTKRLLAVVTGAAGGFAYYHYVGCASGTCPITGNPWISTLYGGLIGWLMVPKPAVAPVPASTDESSPASGQTSSLNNP